MSKIKVLQVCHIFCYLITHSRPLNWYDVKLATATIRGGRGHTTTNFRYASFSFKHLRNQL